MKVTVKLKHLLSQGHIDQRDSFYKIYMERDLHKRRFTMGAYRNYKAIEVLQSTIQEPVTQESHSCNSVLNPRAWEARDPRKGTEGRRWLWWACLCMDVSVLPRVFGGQ